MLKIEYRFTHSFGSQRRNGIADNISKILDTDSWEVTSYFFSSLSIKNWVLISKIDLPHFNSKFYDYITEAVDAFTQDLAGVLNWKVSPIYLVNKEKFSLSILWCAWHS
jgi:sulfate adenylyltransferase subunit 1 (EFTu-like GTPase family)